MSRLIDWAPAYAGVVLLLLVFPAQAGTQFPGIGRTATPAEITAWDIDVRPDFKGLPPGSGSVAQGQGIWEDKCASCHGTFGESNEVFTPLVGGTTADDIRRGHVRTLVTGDVARTTFMKLSSISTLWDYVRRAMPWNAPKSLSTDEVYASVAYLLNLADIVPGDFVLSERNIADVQKRLPNRDGMTRAHGMWAVGARGDVANVACMKDCMTEVKVASEFPRSASDLHGDPAQQNRTLGMNLAAATAPAAPAESPINLAKRKNCLACHAVSTKIVGPAFNDIAAKYRGQKDAPDRLAKKILHGGSGAWGSVPMPANPAVSAAEATVLSRWALGL